MPSFRSNSSNTFNSLAIDDHYFRDEHHCQCCGQAVENLSLASAGNLQRQHFQFAPSDTLIQMKFMKVNGKMKSVSGTTLKLMME
jgi:hypothetical protein